MQVRRDDAGGNGAERDYGSKEYRRGSRQGSLHLCSRLYEEIPEQPQ
jgi:hypothetical protein